MTKYYTLGLNIYIEKTGDIEIVYIFKDNEIETKHKIPDIYLSLMEYTYKEKYMSLFFRRMTKFKRDIAKKEKRNNRKTV